MPIRRAKASDKPTIASIATTAFFDEHLFGDVIHPHRHQFPDDVIIFWHDSLHKHYNASDTVIIVATTAATETEELVGFAVWQRQGADEGAKKVQTAFIKPDPNTFPALPTIRNRAMDPTKRTVLEDSFPQFAHYWAGARKDNWYLSLCGIHPDYQGRGYGRDLVHWGLDRAREENVHASVIASFEKEAFYLRSGFDDIVGNCTLGEGNPLSGVKGGDILFMWPKGHGKMVDVQADS